MNKIYTTFIFLLFTSFCAAQSSDLGNWLVYNGNKKINTHWDWHSEVQYRNYNAVGDLEQLLLRTGIGYTFNAGKTNVLMGYGFINSQNYIPNTDDKEAVNEHRVFQQLVTRQKIGVFQLQHRYRIEERWIEDQDFKLRFRYSLSFNIPLNNLDMVDKTFYLAASNEIFLNHTDIVFDRNRVYGGIGYILNKSLKFEVGYMNQILNDTSRDQMNIATFLSF